MPTIMTKTRTVLGVILALAAVHTGACDTMNGVDQSAGDDAVELRVLRVEPSVSTPEDVVGHDS